jgi:hypothetical protein
MLMNSIFSPHTYRISALHKTALARGIFTFLGCLGLALLIEIVARLFFIPFPQPRLR